MLTHPHHMLPESHQWRDPNPRRTPFRKCFVPTATSPEATHHDNLGDAAMPGTGRKLADVYSPRSVSQLPLLPSTNPPKLAVFVDTNITSPLSPPGPSEETENSNNYHTRHKTALYKSISLDSLLIRASVYCRWLKSTPPPLSNAT